MSAEDIDSRVSHVLNLQAQLKSDRANFDTNWQTVAEHVLPNDSDFIAQWTEGQRRTNRIFDSTAPEALKHGCAALESMMCPANAIWHRLRPLDPDLRNDISIAQYCDQINSILFRARYAPGANFQGQVGMSLQQFMAFGNGPMLIDDVVGYGLRYRAMHLAQTWGVENAAGVIDTVVVERQYTASAALDALKRGVFDSLPDDIEKAAKTAKQATRKFTFYQLIQPNHDRKPRDRSPKGMAFSSITVCQEQKCIVKESGYRTQPIVFPRFRVAPKETYGRGPSVDVLPEILMLNEMRKVWLRQAQRAIEPPLVAADDGSLPAFSLRGNSINYGWLNPQTGKPNVAPFEVGGNFEISKETLDDARRTVQAAHFNDVFSILVEHPEMTATEVLQRAQEQGQLVSPVIGRVQSEWFGPMITRELDILDRAGQLPPPPDKLKRMGGIEFDVVYESQIQVTQRKSKALAITSVLQQVAPIAQIDPNALKRLNPDRMLKELVDGNGAPAAILNTDEEQQGVDAAAQQQQQLTNLATIAGPASQAIKNIGDAQKAGLSVVPGNVGA